MGKFAGVQFETLCRPADPGVVLQEWLDGLEDLAESVAGYDDEDVADAFEAVLEFDERLEIARKRRARQVSRIHALVPKLCELRAVAPPEPYRPPASCELQCERGAPGARAENRNRL